MSVLDTVLKKAGRVRGRDEGVARPYWARGNSYVLLLRLLRLPPTTIISGVWTVVEAVSLCPFCVNRKGSCVNHALLSGAVYLSLPTSPFLWDWHLLVTVKKHTASMLEEGRSEL